MISACMLFDSNFSIEGWLCCKSIIDFDPTMKIYVLCLDQRVFQEAYKYKNNIIPIQLYDLENYYPDLFKARLTRPWNAYTQTCKVFIPSYIFDIYNENCVYYVDSDLYFWDKSSQINDILGSYSFMVTSRESGEPPPRQGRYNGGFYACKNDKLGNKFLKWWQKKTIEWCLWKPGEGGRFSEEGYFNIFYDQPEKFKGVLISKHHGINLAYWNMCKHQLKIKNDKIYVDNDLLICFHYQGLKINKNGYDASVRFRDNVSKYIYDSYYKKYCLFREDFLNDLDCNWWG